MILSGKPTLSADRTQSCINHFRADVRLWASGKRQGSLCPRCKQPITQETGWNIHHVVKKVLGGKDELSNLMLLHPNCHRQLHSNEAGPS